MRRFFGVAALVLLAGLIAVAQIHGTPASVTSLGPQGQIRGTPASVTSLGPFGWQVPPFIHVPAGVHPRLGKNFWGNRFGYGYGYGVALPYYAPFPMMYPDASGAYGSPYDYYPGGDPSMGVDPRAYNPGPNSPYPNAPYPYPNAPYNMAPNSQAAPPSAPATASAPSSAAVSASQPTPDPEPTVLVFLDGHRLEVRNYAIVGNNLYELTSDGGRRTIPLSELDLPATSQANQERGSDFTLPTPHGG
jgi:hypothetical protein